MTALVSLEQEKIIILRISYEKSRLKRNITWLEPGDKNTIFFRKYVEHRRNIHSIWELKNDGLHILDKEELESLVSSHFESHFQEGDKISVRYQIQVIKEYPIFSSQVEGDDIFSLCANG